MEQADPFQKPWLQDRQEERLEQVLQGLMQEVQIFVELFAKYPEGQVVRHE